MKCGFFQMKHGLVVAGLIFLSSFSNFAGGVVLDNPIEKKEPVRFDHTVREDFFAGFGGDEKSLQRAMGTCDKVLAIEPNHAEAMVWLGGGLVFLSGRNFSKGNFVEGMKNWQAGIAMMDKAVELEPENIGVLIPRAAVLMPASRELPDAIRKPVLEGVRKNFEHIYSLQKDSLDKIGDHPLGELRMGLADVYRLLGHFDESRTHLEAVSKELPDSDYSKEAKKWLESKPTEKLAHNCFGCHSK